MASNGLDRSIARAVTVLLVLLCGLTAEQVVAQSSVAEIVAAATQSAEQLDPNLITDIEPAQADFLAATDALRGHLTQTASDENAQAWLSYLEVESVVDGIESNASELELAGKSTRVSQRATGMHPGLEVPAVMRLRAAAESYGNALRFRRKERITELLATQLVKFADQWAELEAQPTPDQIATLRLLLDLLDRTQQNVPLVDRALDQFSSANIHVTIDEALIQRSVNRNVNQCSPVRDCILGTRIVGNAQLTGHVTATLLPSMGSVRIQVALSGTVDSKNFGYNGPVRLRTSGYGQVNATRTIEVAESGVRLEPVVVNAASLTTRIDAIEHPLGLVRRIARKKAAQQKPKADRITRGRFISRISEAFAKETNASASEPIPDVMAEARPHLQRLNLPEPTHTLGSTSDSILLGVTIRKNNQLAAPTEPPPVLVSNEATVQIHESLIDNTIGAVLAGRTMTRSQLQALASKTGRDDADQDDASEAVDDEPEFEIDFDRSRPIIFEARGGNLRIGIRGTRFAQGSRELKRALEVVAIYRPIKTESGEILLNRVGEAQINFPGTKRLSVSQAGLRGSIQKGFADAFPQILMDQPWTVPSTIEVPALQGRTYHPRYFDAQGGWLTLGVSS